MRVNDIRTIATELQQTFCQLFDKQSVSTMHYNSSAIEAFSRRYRQRQESSPSTGSPLRPKISYDEPLSVLIEDFVEMITTRFSDLGHRQDEESNSRTFQRCVYSDNSPNMFDDLRQMPSPLEKYNSYQTLQMIDIWFSHHPFSFILSKTLLLRSYRDGTHSNILLAAILADVNFGQQEPETREKGEEMFNWANSRLFDIPSVSIDLSTVQALALLGWHALCTNRARRCISYFFHAYKIVSSLEMPTTQLNQINGMDIGEVEAEVAINVRWLTFSIILWGTMQMDLPLHDLLPSSLGSRFPPSHESKSAVFALDVASDNISTLTSQAKTIRDLWPVSHVASTTAHIYALSPQEQCLAETSVAPCWQSNTLNRLKLLSNPQQNAPRDLSSVCSNIRFILVAALELLESHSGDRNSQALLLSAYYTMIIHFLFPHTTNGNDSIVVTESLINDFCSSARTILRVSPALDCRFDSSGMNLGLGPHPMGEVFALGLDACGRVLTHIQARAASFKAGSEGRLILAKHDELARLAADLRDLSVNENIRKTNRARAAKKQLKQVMQEFDDDDKSDIAQSLEFPPLEYQPILSMDTDASALPTEYLPGLTNSPTEDSSTSTPSHSRLPSYNDSLPQPTFSSFDMNSIEFPTYANNTAFISPSSSGLDWGAADVLDPRMIDYNVTPEFAVPDYSGQKNFNVYHDRGETSGGACFDDSAFRLR